MSLQGKIYVIRAPGTEKIYIGSTLQSLDDRLREHRMKTAFNKNTCSSKQLIEIPGHYIELLENFPCNTRTELRRREGWHIRLHGGHAVNKNIAGRTQQEYIAEHIETYRKRALNWYYCNKERRKAYDESIKEKRKEYQKAYYQAFVKPARIAIRESLKAMEVTTQ